MTDVLKDFTKEDTFSGVINGIWISVKKIKKYYIFHYYFNTTYGMKYSLALLMYLDTNGTVHAKPIFNEKDSFEATRYSIELYNNSPRCILFKALDYFGSNFIVDISTMKILKREINY